MTIRTSEVEVAALFERTKRYRHEELSLRKHGRSIAEDLPISCLSTQDGSYIHHGYFCHINALYYNIYAHVMFMVDDLMF
jgi:hypothetical protein